MKASLLLLAVLLAAALLVSNPDEDVVASRSLSESETVANSASVAKRAETARDEREQVGGLPDVAVLESPDPAAVTPDRDARSLARLLASAQRRGFQPPETAVQQPNREAVEAFTAAFAEALAQDERNNP